MIEKINSILKSLFSEFQTEKPDKFDALGQV